VLAVELHHLGVELLGLFLVLLAQLGDLRRELALLGHRPALVDELELLKRREEQPDDDRDHDDRHAVGTDGLHHRHTLEVAVDGAEQPRQRVLDDQRPQIDDGQEDVEYRVVLLRAAQKNGVKLLNGRQGTGS
jgi:hypothetical protein